MQLIATRCVLMLDCLFRLLLLFAPFQVRLGLLSETRKSLSTLTISIQNVCLQRNVFENQSINQLFFKRHSQRGVAWLGLSSPSWLRYRCLSESDISQPSNKVNDDWRHNLPVLEYFLCMFFNSGFSVVVTGTARDDKT